MPPNRDAERCGSWIVMTENMTGWSSERLATGRDRSTSTKKVGDEGGLSAIPGRAPYNGRGPSNPSAGGSRHRTLRPKQLSQPRPDLVGQGRRQDTKLPLELADS